MIYVDSNAVDVLMKKALRAWNRQCHSAVLDLKQRLVGARDDRDRPEVVRSHRDFASNELRVPNTCIAMPEGKPMAVPGSRAAVSLHMHTAKAYFFEIPESKRTPPAPFDLERARLLNDAARWRRRRRRRGRPFEAGRLDAPASSLPGSKAAAGRDGRAGLFGLLQLARCYWTDA